MLCLRFANPRHGHAAIEEAMRLGLKHLYLETASLFIVEGPIPALTQFALLFTEVSVIFVPPEATATALPPEKKATEAARKTRKPYCARSTPPHLHCNHRYGGKKRRR